jgi:hypothetical protein
MPDLFQHVSSPALCVFQTTSEKRRVLAAACCMRAFKDRITRQILEICLGFRFEIRTVEETERKKASLLWRSRSAVVRKTPKNYVEVMIVMAPALCPAQLVHPWMQFTNPTVQD